IIVFVSAPIGALVYLFAGREPDRHDPPAVLGQPGAPPSARPVLADDGAAQPPRDLLPILSTSGLTRDYGGTGLFDVDLVVPRGSIYGLVGPNGAGKTTLLSLLAGTRRPGRGTVSLTVARRRIAVCPDLPEFDGWLTAAEVVDLARSLVAPDADGEDVAAALRAAGLADSAGRRVGGFSRGMAQRLGLACALVGDPELLILDEPTAALDPAGRVEMLGLVAAMRGRRTVIFSSHILADVQRIADQVGILRDGRLLYQGATRDLIGTYLKPSWLVRIAGDPAPVAAAMAGERWATRVEPVAPDTIRIDATSIEAGERGIPAVISACAARQVSCEPAAADLESAFLALTGASA
ncbi:MAG TPA: ABC transporter ATP-binding protein, partial [Streptosporangiaceae bacterium]|nr:ABC transporter ATP-binding protein [Streptosporangiaceae bacterium]